MIVTLAFRLVLLTLENIEHVEISRLFKVKKRFDDF
jgi:hypothetical protein